MKKVSLWAAVLMFFACQVGAMAQDQSSRSIPDEDFYLMPSFSNGLIFFSNRPMAQGKVNICAVDQSLRFIDGKGQELEATDIDTIIKVIIDNVSFIRKYDAFYRLYPYSENVSIAKLRTLKIIRGEQKGAYGTVSQTSSIKEYSSLYTEGGAYKLGAGEKVPYEVSETFFLYDGADLYSINKKGLRKLFRDKKDDVEKYFKEGHRVPETLEGVQEMLSNFIEKQPQ